MFKHMLFAATALSLVVAGNAFAQNDNTPPAGFGAKWEDAAKMPDFFSGMWESVGGMTDGKVDVGYTQKAKDYMAQYKPKKDIAYAGEGCKSPGLPIVQRSGSPLKFQFSPGLISVYIENASMTRFLHLNGKHNDISNPTYLGESIAHFEGDTLVVDTVDFRDDITFQYGVMGSTVGGPGGPGAAAPGGPGAGAPGAGGPPPGFGGGGGPFSRVVFGPHGPNLRMVERIKLRDADTLEVNMTVYDDTVFTTPYVSPTQLYKRLKGAEASPGEWQCDISQIMAYDPEKDKSEALTPEEAMKRLDEGTLH
jgi:hypothetical protein